MPKMAPDKHPRSRAGGDGAPRGNDGRDDQERLEGTFPMPLFAPVTTQSLPAMLPAALDIAGGPCAATSLRPAKALRNERGLWNYGNW